MYHSNQNMRYDERREDKPQHSRLFVVCGKDVSVQELRDPFEKFGEITDIHLPKDRSSGDSKGFAYIQYSKTSSAALALREMNLKGLGKSNKPLKVMIAAAKGDHMQNGSVEMPTRLFIKVSKEATVDEIRQYFGQFGEVSVYIQKYKGSNESKGLAYVQFKTFVDAAKASEESDPKYKAVFAVPKQELKRTRDNSDFFQEGFYSNTSHVQNNGINETLYSQPRDNMPPQRTNINSLIQTPPQNYKAVAVTCDSIISKKHVERLFNIVPGMVQCKYSADTYNGVCKAIITYEDGRAAAYAVERLDNFEFPSGVLVHVKPDNALNQAASDLTQMVNSFKEALDSGHPDLMQLADAISKASTLIKVATTSRVEMQPQISNYCNIPLPPAQPLADEKAKVAQRCFLVFKPSPPPIQALRDIFCCFGDLIDVYTLPNKTYGFAKYASVKAAQDAISTLRDLIVCGVRVKVLEADERERRTNNDVEKMNVDSDLSDNSEFKRMKVTDNETD